MDELQALHGEVYAAPPYGAGGDAATFASRFRVQRRQPGFVLAEARHGGYLVGYAAGFPLRPSTSWWAAPDRPGAGRGHGRAPGPHVRGGRVAGPGRRGGARVSAGPCTT